MVSCLASINPTPARPPPPRVPVVIAEDNSSCFGFAGHTAGAGDRTTTPSGTEIACQIAQSNCG